MPENENATPGAVPNAAPTPGAPPSTPAPVGSPGDNSASGAATLESTGFRWGDRAPEWLRGKDADATLDIVGKLVTALESVAAAPPAAPTHQPTVTMPDNAAPAIDDDLLVTNPAEWRRRFAAQQDAQMQATLNAAGAPMAANMASITAELSKRDAANADVAGKWWGEVEALVAPIPQHLRSKDLYDQAAKLARSNHLDEITEARLTARMAAATGVEGVGSGGVSGNGGAPGGEDPAWAQIRATPMGSRMLERYGKAKLAQAAAAMGGLESYAKMISGSRTEFDPSHPSRMYTELI